MKKSVDFFKDNTTLATLDADALVKEIAKTEKELYLLSQKHQANELKQPHLIGLYRRYAAKLQTLARKA